MHCPRCLVRAYGAVLSSHGYPNPLATNSTTLSTTIRPRSLIYRRALHGTSSRPGRDRIRRPSRIFDGPPPDHSAPFKRGGGMTKEDRLHVANVKRNRTGVEIPPEKGFTKNAFFKSDSRVLAISDEARSRKVDPLKIATTVQKALNGTNREHEEGIELLRELTGKHGRKDLVVSWNHVIDWKLKRGNINEAMKIYNEMKKRGTAPDSHTYLRILNGLAENAATVKSALGRALTIYYSMTAPSSAIKPSIIHTNAALKVCAQAKDVDAMWDIAERIPDKGKGQADSTTYTTILNGIRMAIDGSPDRSITEGREVWENILIKWEQGHIIMDEGLGCAMARLLLRSTKPEDWDEVLSLCQDVFGVPRLLPKYGSKARKLLPIRDPMSPGEKREMDQETTAKMAEEDTMSLRESLDAAISSVAAKRETIGEHTNNEDQDTDEISRRETEESNLDDVDDSAPSGLAPIASDSGSLITSSIPAVKPPIANNGLSLLIEACLSLRAYDTAQNYWELLTESYGVIPDRDNYHNRMRMLSLLNDSAGAVSLVEEMIKNRIETNPNIFFIALNGCRRSRSVNGFKDALKLLDLMKSNDVEMTSKAIIAFIRSAMATEDVGVLKQAWMKLGPGTFNIHKLIDPANKTVDKIARDLECCQELVALSDSLLSKMYQRQLDRQETAFADDVTNSRKKISRYISDYFNTTGAADSGKGKPTDKIRSFRELTRAQKLESKPLFNVEKINNKAKFGRFEKLGAGEESLEGLNFRPKARNRIAETAGFREKDTRRPKSFLTEKRRTNFTAHYRPSKVAREEKRQDRFRH